MIASGKLRPHVITCAGHPSQVHEYQEFEPQDRDWPTGRPRQDLGLHSAKLAARSIPKLDDCAGTKQSPSWTSFTPFSWVRQVPCGLGWVVAAFRNDIRCDACFSVWLVLLRPIRTFSVRMLLCRRQVSESLALVEAKRLDKLEEFEDVWIWSLLHRGLVVKQVGSGEYYLSLGDMGAAGVVAWPLEKFRDKGGWAWKLREGIQQDSLWPGGVGVIWLFDTCARRQFQGCLSSWASSHIGVGLLRLRSCIQPVIGLARRRPSSLSACFHRTVMPAEARLEHEGDGSDTVDQALK